MGASTGTVHSPTAGVSPVLVRAVAEPALTAETLGDLSQALDELETFRRRVQVDVSSSAHPVMEELIQSGFFLEVTRPDLRRQDVICTFVRDYSNDIQPSTFLPDLREGILADGMLITYPRLDDVEALVAVEHDPHVREHSISPPASTAEILNTVATAYYRWRTGPACAVVVRDNIGGPPVAKLTVRKVVPPRVVDLGYVTVAEHRGKRVAPRALRALTQWLFDAGGIQRVELGIKPENEGSRLTAERAGYQFESVRCGRLANRDGTFADELSYVAINK